MNTEKEIRPFLTLSLCLVSFSLFLLIAYLVFEGHLSALDRTGLLAFRHASDLSDPLGGPYIEQMMWDITALGSHTVLGILVFSVAGYLALTNRKRAALTVLISVGTGVMVSALFKLGFARPRPDLVPHEVNIATTSFPSGHTMLSTVTYLTMAALLTRMEKSHALRLYCISFGVFLSFVIGVSRIYLGVHWPSDVLAGWCIGVCWASLCWVLAFYLQKQGKIERAV